MKSLSFQAPEGFAAPEDAEPGKPFDVLATVVMGENGELSLQAVDGIDVASSSEPEDTEDMGEESEDPGFLGAIESQFA